MSIAAIAGIGSAIGGLFGGSSQNKFLKKQFELQKKLTDKQITIADYVIELSKAAQQFPDDYADYYGGGAQVDPLTGQYKATLGGAQRGIQDAADDEELARYTIDQQIRRQGIQDVERRRGQASVEADTSLRDVQDFKRGVGTVESDRIGSQIRNDRVGAVNAAFDETANQANTIGLRTGNTAIADTLARLAKSRANTAAQIGSPEIEGLQIAEGINNNRFNQRMGAYGAFTDQANNIVDAGFAPATYADKAADRVETAMNYKLGKTGLGIEGASAAGNAVNSAASGQRQAADIYNKSKNWNLIGALGALGANAGGLGKGLNLGSLFGKGG